MSVPDESINYWAILGPIAGVLVFVGLAFYIFVPTTYVTVNDEFVVAYRLSDKKCIHYPHDRWGQFPIICTKKDNNTSIFAPKVVAQN